MEDKPNPVGYAAHWSERDIIRRVFLPIVAGAPMVLGYCDMLLVVEPVQPTAFPGYSSTSATCCCPMPQQYLVPPVAVPGYSSGDEHWSEMDIGVLAQISLTLPLNGNRIVVLQQDPSILVRTRP